MNAERCQPECVKLLKMKRNINAQNRRYCCFSVPSLSHHCRHVTKARPISSRFTILWKLRSPSRRRHYLCTSSAIRAFVTSPFVSIPALFRGETNLTNHVNIQYLNRRALVFCRRIINLLYSSRMKQMKSVYKF